MFDFNSNILIAAALIVLIIILAVFFHFIDLNIPFISWTKNIVYNFLTSILNLLHQISEKIKNFFVTLFSINKVNQELKDLRQKNGILERQILFLENIQKENKRLRNLLNFQKKVEYEMIGAEVIANSPSVWEKTITINRGTKDGLKERMPVITYQGYLVGRIDNLGSNSAQVRLITDHEFIVGGIIARTDSREIGLVKGSGRDDRANIMDNIAWDADIKKNDVILSSGLSKNFPPGLKIGKIKNVETDNYGLSQKAEIELYLNDVTLEEVMIIKQFNNQQNNKFNEQQINEKIKKN